MAERNGTEINKLLIIPYNVKHLALDQTSASSKGVRMMQEYPDAKQHFEQHLDSAIGEYRAGLEKRGLQPNETINRAFFDRTVKAARQDYQDRCDEVFLHNFQKVEAESKRTMKQIKRRGTLQAFLMCPPIALVFAVLAWYNFSQHDPATGIVCCCGALAFLAILIVKVVVDR